MAEKFERFTDAARRVLARAHEEAHRFNHNYIGTEHLMLGLLRVPDTGAVRVLEEVGVTLPEARRTIESMIGRGDSMIVGEIRLTPRAKKVIELAVEEARRLDQHFVGTEHLLLGLLREGEGIAAGALESMGVNLENVREQVLRNMRPGGEPSRIELIRREPPTPAFGELRRVLAVGESRTVDSVEATILSLELYERGTVLHVRLRRLSADETTPSRRWQGPILVRINDDTGRPLPNERHPTFQPAEDASFITNRFTAPVGVDARQLKITMDGGPDPNYDPMPPEQAVNRASRSPGVGSVPASPPGHRHWEFEVEL